MLSIQVDMVGKGKRTVSYQTKKDGEGKFGSESPQTMKKEKHSRHSYHPAGNSNFSLGYPTVVEGVPNSFNYAYRHPFITRERSFVRPQSNHVHIQGNLLEGAVMQRQRSFVLPGQLQKQGREAPQHQHHQQQQHHRRRSAMPASHRGKPALEIYRPPTLRGPNIFENNNGDFYYNGKSNNDPNDMHPATTITNDSQMNYNARTNQSMAPHANGVTNKPGLNIHAKEFVLTGDTTTTDSLQHSKSSGNLQHQIRRQGLQHSKSGHSLRHAGAASGPEKGSVSPSPRVHFSDDKENELYQKTGPVSRPPSLAVKRSKSLGSADIKQAIANGDNSPLKDIGPFAQDVQTTISKATNDPNALSARQLMEVSRHLFTRVMEASKYAEPTARLCITIIENETGETFLETLLNTCQEYFQERNRLLRTNQPGPYPGYIASHPRWIGYMSFLNEMYTQLKRRHVQLMTRRMRNSETAPGLLLLNLLSECCHVCLREQAVNSLAETECLFFVLTAVGKDIEVELPQQMGRVMGAARDAFLTTVHVSAVRKTLLQLIEMHAARWQLPASAVMYYYPGSSAK